jgi:hypothetical protein
MKIAIEVGWSAMTIKAGLLVRRVLSASWF